MQNWFSMKAAADGATADIAIYDEIGLWGITAKDFAGELKSVAGKASTLNLTINSPGGSVFDGVAIYNMLARHPARKIVTVDGLAASMASLIAMVGDEVRMPANAMMMIHDPWGGVVGNSRDMRDVADALDKIKSAMITSYAGKSGLPADQVAAIMADETWLTAEDAVAQHFADTILPARKMAASFNLNRFRNAPRALTEESAMTDTGTAAAAANEDLDPAATAAEAGATETAEAGAEAGQEAAEAGQEAATAAAGAEVSATATDGVAEAVAAAVAAANARAKEIVAACAIAGQHGKAAEYIASGKSVGDVLAELQTARATGGAPAVNSRVQPGRSEAVAAATAWQKHIDRINARAPAGAK